MEELAWAAGFFDGEGYSGCVAGKLRAAIGQRDREVLDRFQKAVGLGKVLGPYNDRGKPIYRWQANGHANVLRVYELLYRHLGTLKRTQFSGAFLKWHAR